MLFESGASETKYFPSVLLGSLIGLPFTSIGVPAGTFSPLTVATLSSDLNRLLYDNGNVFTFPLLYLTSTVAFVYVFTISSIVFGVSIPLNLTESIVIFSLAATFEGAKAGI